MARKLLLVIVLALLFFSLVSPGFALEKAKLGTSVKTSATYYLPVLTAEEKGFWKESGLDVEWVPFAGGPAQIRAVAAGTLNIGIAPSATVLTAAGAGLPVLMVSELVPTEAFSMWVKGDSPYRHPRDLKGARIGVTALGSSPHALGRIIVGAHGMEKDVRFVGAGGVPESVAGVRAGAFEATVFSLGSGVELKVAGILRDIANVSDYLPKPWVDQVVFVRKDFAQSRPDLVRKMLKATLQSLDFIRKNPRWTMDKMKSFQGLSEEAAKLMYDYTKFTTSGKLDRKAVENTRKVFIEYGLITEKAPEVDELFTNEYLS